MPAFCIAAACAAGETVLTGAAELRVKESDRIAVMAAGLQTLGVEVEVLPDGMRIQGKPTGPAFNAGVIDSHGDHRIAMAFAMASLRAAGPIRIRDTANVGTSFPGFVATARAIGLDLAEHPE
jgi:3-phosphoshikimate 1-carboxyvinyltransferase